MAEVKSRQAEQVAEKSICTPSGVKTPEKSGCYVVPEGTTHNYFHFFRSQLALDFLVEGQAVWSLTC
ncbi:MAG TPA: hypothetical protein VNI36_07500 [Candidatus Dormibacteraeota bacterium]|nr:hypothetical protein [Candidatus Dormibacteraeota bacterium]